MGHFSDYLEGRTVPTDTAPSQLWCKLLYLSESMDFAAYVRLSDLADLDTLLIKLIIAQWRLTS